jgi:hypothetical protein
MKRFVSIRALWIGLLALLISVLTPGIAFAPWNRKADLAYFDFAVCRDGARLALSDTEYEPETPGEVPQTIPRGEVHTYAPVFTSPPEVGVPGEPRPAPLPRSVVFAKPMELRFAPVGNPEEPADPDPNAYSRHFEILWDRTLSPGDTVAFDFAPADPDLIPGVHEVGSCFLDRSLDIRPYTPSNKIVPTSRSRLLVLVKTSSFIDATKIKNNTVRFGPGGARPLSWETFDFDDDGDRDRLFVFRTRHAAIPCGAKSAALTASTRTPGPIRITPGPTHYQLYDSVRTVRC